MTSIVKDAKRSVYAGRILTDSVGISTSIASSYNDISGISHEGSSVNSHFTYGGGGGHFRVLSY